VKPQWTYKRICALWGGKIKLWKGKYISFSGGKSDFEGETNRECNRKIGKMY
jgi:hypothetical protein